MCALVKCDMYFETEGIYDTVDSVTYVDA